MDASCEIENEELRQKAKEVILLFNGLVDTEAKHYYMSTSEHNIVFQTEKQVSLEGSLRIFYERHCEWIQEISVAFIDVYSGTESRLEVTVTLCKNAVIPKVQPKAQITGTVQKDLVEIKDTFSERILGAIAECLRYLLASNEVFDIFTGKTKNGGAVLICQGIHRVRYSMLLQQRQACGDLLSDVVIGHRGKMSTADEAEKSEFASYVEYRFALDKKRRRE